jgi:ATP-dependent DNA helicase RecQ
MPRPQSLVLLDSHGVPVARLSRAGSDRWRVRLDQVVEARVIAMLVRKQSDEQPEFRARCRCQQWEVPLVEIVCVGRAGATRSLSQTVDELLT